MRFERSNRSSKFQPAKLAASALLAAAFLALPRAALADAPDVGNKPYEYEYMFPIWGDKLASKGIRFPLPFGIGINYAYIHQDINIDNVQLAVNDGQFVDLSNIVKFESVESTVMGLSGRLDLWVLPFLNVYGLATYAADSDTDVLLSDPFALRSGASQTGYGGGFGFTGAFGVLGFFATLDVNFTWNKVEKLDSAVRTFLLTPRIGKKFRLGKVALSPWVGAMRQDIEVDTSGSIALSEAIGEPSDEFQEKMGNWYNSLPPGQQIVVGQVVERLQGVRDATIRYKLDKSLADPWNMLLGMEADFSDRVQLRTEFGFIGRTQMILGLNYRFGLITH
jgi:hypothetical protein